MDLREKKLSSKTLYKGKFLTIEHDSVLVPNGNISDREVVRHPGAAAIIAFVDNKIVFERQYRYAVDKTLLEIPAGKRDIGEDTIITAKRELMEETGYIAGNMKYLGSIYTSVGFCDEKIDIYLAKNLTKGDTNFDIDEIIELEYYTLEEVKAMIRDGVITDAKTISAIMMYITNEK